MSTNSCSSSLITLILSFILVLGTIFLVSPVTATDHIVGANKGWNPTINYTSWANNQTIFVAFRYKKSEHNVFEVNKTGYENCSTEGSIGNWTNGKDFIQFKKPGRYYFICGNGGCSLGKKVSVVVHRLPPSSSASVMEHTGQKSDKDSNSASGGSFGWLLSFGLFVVVMALNVC